MSELTPGVRLGPYEIVSAIGSGGMGEVYKARDTRLDRTVAIKVLPRAVVPSPELRARFEREARAISALEHPNICVLHDVGREGDLEYLVMQYLEGETLAARLARGPLPLDEALRYATDIASALDKAHRAGILHRDLKPGNIMLTKSGSRERSAKLLDFGLAKLAPAADDPARPQLTATSPLTGQGAILGTLLYMSPEQLEGREVDARSDIFSFGTVLYEMVTGTRAFDGPSQASIIGAILEREPEPIATRVPLTPPALDRVVRKCLAKDPERRWQTAADLCDELSWIAHSSGIHAPPGHAAPRRTSRLRTDQAAALVLILALAGALGWALLRSGESETTASPRVLSVAIPSGLRLAPGGLAISPDGTTLVYAAASATSVDGHRPSVATSSARLYLRRFDSATATVMAGSEGARTPFFSPDGSAVAFFTDTSLMRISLVDGSLVKITSMPPVSRGGTWLPDDTIIVTPTQGSGLLRIPASGGSGQPLTNPDPSTGEKAHMWPSGLPGGSALLYTIRRGTASNEDDTDVAVLDLPSGTSRVILRRAAYARYAPTGHLLFVRAKALMAVPFDADAREISGAEVRVAEGISTNPWIGGGHFAVAPDGTLALVRGSFGQFKSSAVWVDRSGAPVASPAFTEQELGKPRIGPDARRGTFDGTSADGDTEIYIADLSRGTTVRFSADPQDDFNAIWTPDGSRIIWTALPAGRLPFLVWRAADGTGKTEELVKSDLAQFAGSVSRDWIFAYSQSAGGRTCDIWVMPLKGERAARPFIATTAHEYGPEFSPDGQWIAYVSDEAGQPDVYVVPYPGPGEKRRLTSAGGAAVAWSRDGKELFYQTPGALMSIPVTPGTPLQFGEPRLLFKGNFITNSREDGPREYDVAPGSQRFLMVKFEQATGAAPLTLDVLSHWWR